MSVNGQDPRANVYLLDGTLLNDFTNGPAGSAAGTALGMETVREFRVESNTYSAEFGRNVGGQINVITQSGTNRLDGSAFEFHRNDALDARNYFDVGSKPDFTRNQFGGTVGGPLRRDRLFFLRRLRSAAREPRPDRSSPPCRTTTRGWACCRPDRSPIDPAVRPYLDEFPQRQRREPRRRPGPLHVSVRSAARSELLPGAGRRRAARAARSSSCATRSTTPISGCRPTFPQFPRAFISRNQFLTGEYRQAFGADRAHRARRLQPHAHRPERRGQHEPAAAGVRAGPRQHGRDRHRRLAAVRPAELGEPAAAAGRHQRAVRRRAVARPPPRSRPGRSSSTTPTTSSTRRSAWASSVSRTCRLSCGTFRRSSSASRRRATSRATGTGRCTGFYVQDDFAMSPNADAQSRPAPRRHDDAHAIARTATSTCRICSRRRRRSGRSTRTRAPSWSPRLGAAWDVRGDGRTSVRGGYGLYFNTNNQQNLIVTVTNPPATPRVVIANPTFPVPPFERATGISVRPIQYDVQYPRVHMWNVNVQQEFWSDWARDARRRGIARPAPVAQFGSERPDADDAGRRHAVLRRRAAAPESTFSAIEVKSSDGDSWYRALIVDVRKRWSQGLQMQSAYTWSRAEDTTQNSTFFSDSTTATTSAMPEFIPGLQQGPLRLPRRAQLDRELRLGSAARRRAVGCGRQRSSTGGDVSGIVRVAQRQSADAVPAERTVRDRCGRRRSARAPGRIGRATRPAAGRRTRCSGGPNRWLDPTAFVLPEAGTFGNVGRNELIGPGLATVDVSFSRQFGWRRLGSRHAHRPARSRSSTCSIARTSARPRWSSSPARPTAKRRCRRSARSGRP